MMYSHPRDPLRPLNWRWLDACQGVPPKRFQKLCDPLVLDLAHWIERRGCDPAAWGEPGGRLKGLHDAALIEAAGGVFRDELQAWLLSGRDHETIGGRMGMTPAAIRMYVAVFSDFGAPQAIDGILLRAVRIGDWTYRRPTEAEIWKYLALAGGPFVLELVLADYFGRPEPEYKDRAQTAQLLRALVCAFAEGLRSPLEVREVLAMADLWLASMQNRGVTSEPMVAAYIQFLRRVNALQSGLTSAGRTPVVTPVSAWRADVSDRAGVGSRTVSA